MRSLCWLLVGTFLTTACQDHQAPGVPAGNSRVYGGIHYRHSCDSGQKQGKVIAQNVAQKLKFKK